MNTVGGGESSGWVKPHLNLLLLSGGSQRCLRRRERQYLARNGHLHGIGFEKLGGHLCRREAAANNERYASHCAGNDIASAFLHVRTIEMCRAVIVGPETSEIFR